MNVVSFLIKKNIVTIDDVIKPDFKFGKGIVFARQVIAMTGEKNILELPDNIITINTALDAHYWSERLSISPFTLFHVVRTVGNRLSVIVEFLHRTESTTLTPRTQTPKEVTIL